MQTICLYGSDYHSSGEVHAALRRLLGLPDYYGMNADALHDCLSERAEPVNLWLASPGEGEASAALRAVCRVIEELGGEVKEL